jgi:integrase
MAVTRIELKSGLRWEVRIAVYDELTGKRSNRNLGRCRTKAEAQAREREALAERDRGVLVDPKAITVAELLDRFLMDELPKTVAPENRQEYTVIVNKHIKPAIGGLRVQKLRAEHIDRFYGDLINHGYSPSLIRKCHQRLNQAIRMAVRWQIVGRNVAESVRPPKMISAPPRAWSAGEAAQFLHTARDHDEPLYVYWHLMLETGARTSELLGLSWRDVDLEAGTLRLGRQVVRLSHGTPVVKSGGKTEAAARTLRLLPETVELLREFHRAWLAGRQRAAEWHDEHDLVFVSRTGHPLNARNVRRAFDRVVKIAGVTQISPHEVRKTAITLAIQGGAPVKGIAARVGHRDPATTLKTYTQLTRGMEDQTTEAIAALMRATPTRSDRGDSAESTRDSAGETW